MIHTYSLYPASARPLPPTTSIPLSFFLHTPTVTLSLDVLSRCEQHQHYIVHTPSELTALVSTSTLPVRLRFLSVQLLLRLPAALSLFLTPGRIHLYLFLPAIGRCFFPPTRLYQHSPNLQAARTGLEQHNSARCVTLRFSRPIFASPFHSTRLCGQLPCAHSQVRVLLAYQEPPLSRSPSSLHSTSCSVEPSYRADENAEC